MSKKSLHYVNKRFTILTKVYDPFIKESKNQISVTLLMSVIYGLCDGSNCLRGSERIQIGKLLCLFGTKNYKRLKGPFYEGGTG